jgi:hypothetical protein
MFGQGAQREREAEGNDFTGNHTILKQIEVKQQK